MVNRTAVTVLALLVLLAACSAAPPGAYFPLPTEPATLRVSHILHRAAVAAGDDPDRYGFAFVKSPVAAALSDEEATIYITDGLTRLPAPVIEAVIAHEVAHEVLGHIGTRRVLALSIAAGFSVLGVLAPGANLADILANPIAVRAFTRRQELEADQKAIEILRAMGHPRPRRALADAIATLATVSPRPREDLGGLFSTHPSMEDRLAALEPLEPAEPAATARAPAPSPPAGR